MLFRIDFQDGIYAAIQSIKNPRPEISGQGSVWFDLLMADLPSGESALQF